jgi:predicted DNA-binding protein
MKRTTIFLPTNMLLNLQVLALQTGESQSTIIRTALAAYMVAQGYKPYTKPKVRVVHGRSK